MSSAGCLKRSDEELGGFSLRRVSPCVGVEPRGYPSETGIPLLLAESCARKWSAMADGLGAKRSTLVDPWYFKHRNRSLETTFLGV